VWVRWQGNDLPAADVLGVTAVVGSAGSPLARDAGVRGYRVVPERDASFRLIEGLWPRIRRNFTMRDGKPVLVASRTEQPWIDNNVAWIRIRQSAGERAVLSYPWKPFVPGDDSGPSAEDFARAIAEAGAFGADLVVELDERKLPAWAGARPYLLYYERPLTGQNLANVGVLTREPAAAHLILNLLARHNVPFRVVNSAEAASGLDLVITFEPDAAVPGVAPERVLPVGDGVGDPNGFALKVRNTLGKRRRLVDIWNGITVLTGIWQDRDGSLRIELVNYAAQPVPVQVRVRGAYARVEYARPEASAQSLVVEHIDGFTEFVVPELRIGGTLTLKD
jgi:hypothetical protein